jgi:RNA polymerase sigma-70 factor (ECF subfamily)
MTGPAGAPLEWPAQSGGEGNGVDTDRSPDGPLLTRIVAGDADALGELYDRYSRVVFGLLYRMLPSPEVAEEVLQDVFHAVWRRAASYRAERGTGRTWLLAIARNAAIDWSRRHRRLVGRESPLEEAAAQPDPRTIDQLTGALVLADVVGRALAELPPEQREVIVLAFYLGLSQTEIAARLGEPLGTVKSRARLGMARLRNALAAQERD